METLPPSRPAADLSPQVYDQLVHTMTDLLPPPLDDSPAALRARNHAAITKVAALLPVGAHENDLAAQCITARAQAEDVLRLVRQNADDIDLVMRLNAQYGSTVRTSLSVHGRLMRVQATRQKRDAIEGAATGDAGGQHVVERSMLKVADPSAGRMEVVPPVKVPAACVDQRIEQNVSNNETNSHGAVFGTLMSAPPRNRGTRGSGPTGLHSVLRTAMARSGLDGSGLAGGALPANGRDSPGRPD